jgi:hypothetical protein
VCPSVGCGRRDRLLAAPTRAPYITAMPRRKEPAISETAKPDLPPAALRALAEAEARRREAAGKSALPPELGGRDGPDPVRYGDWEKKGLAVDF